jgi:Lar family restriction alleviation protein
MSTAPNAQGPIDVTVSQSTPLLPCPFCGAEVTMGRNRGGSKIIYFQVECDECGAIAGSGYTTESAAAKNWNRRANVEAHRKDAAGGLSGGAGCSASDATGERRLK